MQQLPIMKVIFMYVKLLLIQVKLKREIKLENLGKKNLSVAMADQCVTKG